MLQSAPALILYYVAHQHHPGPLTDARVRQAINYAVDTKTILDQLMGGRGFLARGVVRRSSTAVTPRAVVMHTMPRKRSSCWPPPAIRTGSMSSSGTRQDAIDRALCHRLCRDILNAAGIRTKLVQRDASSAREAARKGETDMTLKTGTPTIPTPTAFCIRCCTPAAKGPGGNVSFYANPAFDRVVAGRSARTGRGETRNALSVCRLARVRATRRWCRSSSTTTCTRCSPGSATSSSAVSSTVSAGPT